MLKTLKFSTLAIMLVSILVLITQVVKLAGIGISKTALNAINSIGSLFPEYQMYFDKLLNVSNDVKMIIVGAIVSILVVLMLCAIIGCIINYILVKKQIKKSITIGKMISIILIDLVVAFFVISSKSALILSNINAINIMSLILGFLFIAHAIFVAIVLSKFIHDNLKEDILKVQLANLYKYSIRFISIILIGYFFQKIAFVLIVNAAVDTMLRSIDISDVISGVLLGGIDFAKPLSEILPANIVDLALEFNLPTTVSLSSFGISQQTVELLLSVSVYAPLNDAIFNFLNNITNSFIFKNFVHVVIGFTGAITILSINIVNFSKTLIKQIALVSIEVIIILVVLFFMNSLFIVVLLLLILAYDITMLVFAVIEK